MARVPAALLAAFASALAAQEGPTFNQNGLGLHNQQLRAQPVEFPGVRAAGGNLAGDCAWKLFPGETLLTARGSLRLSGFECALEDVDPATPLDHPDLHLYGARRQPGGAWVPDFDRPVVKILLGPIALPAGLSGAPSGSWLINWSLAWPVEVPVSSLEVDRPLAACLMATPGEGPLDGARLRLTDGENYARSPQGSFSGFHDARSGRTGLADGSWAGPEGAYPAGELWMELAFVEPILQPWASSAVAGSQLLQDLGPGALWSDLATGSGPSGVLGWRLESYADGAAATRRYAFLLLNLQGRPRLSISLPGMHMPLALDPREGALALLITGGVGMGLIGAHRPAHLAPDFWDGLFATPTHTFPREPALSGSDWWVGALVVDMDRGTLGAVSNTCAVHIR